MRISRRARWAALALAGPLLAGVMAAMPAKGATTPPWRVWHVYPATSSVNAVAATGSRDAWAAGYQCDSAGKCGGNPLRVEHWNGSVWKTMTPPAGSGGVDAGAGAVTAIAASSPSNAWIFADLQVNADITVARALDGQGLGHADRIPGLGRDRCGGDQRPPRRLGLRCDPRGAELRCPLQRHAMDAGGLP